MEAHWPRSRYTADKSLEEKQTVKTKDIKTTVIASFYNFGDSAASFVESLEAVMSRTGSEWEAVLVDDGSRDDTFEQLKKAVHGRSFMRIIRMRAMFGEAASLEAGLRHSDGETVVFISGRVRVNMDRIPDFISALNQNDMVCAWRKPRRDSWLNRGISWVFNRMACRLSRVRLHDINSGFLVTRRSVLDHVSFYGDLVNFIPVLASQQGYRVSEMPVEQLPGSFRTSRYPKEYLQRLLDMITVFFLSRYSKKPIHFLGFVGTLFVISGLIIEMYLFIYRILRIGGIAGRPLLVLGALLLVIGIQMISIGLLGEMLIFTHAGDIEEYNIEAVINSEKDPRS